MCSNEYLDNVINIHGTIYEKYIYKLCTYLYLMLRICMNQVTQYVKTILASIRDGCLINKGLPESGGYFFIYRWFGRILN